MRRLALAAALLVALAPVASAGENPVFDAETAADIQAALDEATATQGVCYSVRLRVDDVDSGFWAGTYEVRSTPPAGPAGVCGGVVALEASITYTSSYSEEADSASWTVSSTFPDGPTAAGLRDLGLSSRDLLDDGKSEQVLLNAALALPVLTAERVVGVPPIVLVEPTAPLPSAAAATGSPGSDRWREQGTSLLLLGLLLVGSLLSAVAAAVYRPVGDGRYVAAWRRAAGRPARAPRHRHSLHPDLRHHDLGRLDPDHPDPRRPDPETR